MDYTKIYNDMVDYVREYFQNVQGFAIIGISGGKDSAITASICVDALGTNRVLGVLMPNGVQSDIEDSIRIVEDLGIAHTTVNIQSAYDAISDSLSPFHCLNNSVFTSNTPARLRMTVLYGIAACIKGRVFNTCNLSETFVGYATKWGDECGDIGLFHDLKVSDLWEILPLTCFSQEMKSLLLNKAPADGLSGLTDEDNLGFSYKQIDLFLEKGTCGDAAIDAKILNKHTESLHKSFNMHEFRVE